MAKKDQASEDAPVEKAAKTRKASVASSPTSDTAAKAASVILKLTGQKPLEPSYSTMAHVPSGSTLINLLIGGSPATDGHGCVCPGYPRRRITEIYGPESSGKTTTALAAIADCQKRGGLAMFLDFEHALHHGYARTIGVDFATDKLLYYQPDTMEEGLKMLYIGIKAGVDLVVVDSVAAMVPKLELEKKIDENAKLGALAKAMSEILPKMVIWLSKTSEEASQKLGTAVIFLNQTRAAINTGGYGGGGDNENTSGGKALKFYSYLRLRISRIRSDFIEKNDPFTGKKKRIPIGNLVQVKVVKNKADAKQGHGGEVFIRYGYGLDDYLSLIEAGVTRRIISKKGATLEFEGTCIVGKEKFRQYLIENDEAREGIKQKIYESILDSVPKAVVIDDEEAIMSDVRAALGDDETFDAESDAEEEQDVTDEHEDEGGDE
jgi:recombination protein RecA